MLKKIKQRKIKKEREIDSNRKTERERETDIPEIVRERRGEMSGEKEGEREMSYFINFSSHFDLAGFDFPWR